MGIAVTEVCGPRELTEFINVPYSVYARWGNWVPPLKRFQRRDLSADGNPFFRHADVRLFVARENGRAVGRISAQVDWEHNRWHNDGTGFFGFFESPDNPAVAAALTGAAGGWLKERGMERIRGPLSFSINGESGVLLEGFDSPPQIQMPYTPPYYPALLEADGFHKAKDLYAWLFEWTRPPEKARQSVERIRRRPDVLIRTVDMGNFNAEIRTILDIFNEAWAENWGFVPMTGEEGQRMGDDLKLIADPNIAVIVEVEGRAAGVILAVPNLNEAIRGLKGNLFPLGFLKLLWRVKARRVKNGRVLIMGVRKEYRTRKYAALPYLMIDEIMRRGRARGYHWAELSWTLEDNYATNNILANMGCQRYKTYRIYEKETL